MESHSNSNSLNPKAEVQMRSRKSPIDQQHTLSSLISSSNDDSIIELINILKIYKENSNDVIHDEMKNVDNIVMTIKNLLDNTKNREKVLNNILSKHDIRILNIESGNYGINDDDNDEANLLTRNESSDSYQCPLEHQSVSFREALLDRAGWLIGLLTLQSCSSFILASNDKLIQSHPTIIYFLTMLVGAGGNAGNQSSVRIIRGLAVGAVNDYNIRRVIFREMIMAICISFLLGVAGFIRTIFSFQTTYQEKISITASLVLITFISIVGGAFLPLVLKYFKLDPAHASTTIQVIMDISGVLITCIVSYILLDSAFGKYLFYYITGV